MAEYLRVFDPITEKLLGIREREELYAEMREAASCLEQEGVKPISPFVVEFAQLMLVNVVGEFYVSRRSAEKQDNPGLYDKTVGGHVAAILASDIDPTNLSLEQLAEHYGEDFDSALIREAHEELSVNVILTDEIKFQEICQNTDLFQHAVVRRMGYNPAMISRRIAKDGMPWFLRVRLAFYAGVYNGQVEYQKGEVAGHTMISMDDLEFYLRHDPQILTSDIRQIVMDYDPQLRELARTASRLI